MRHFSIKVDHHDHRGKSFESIVMTTLTEIEAAADALPPEQKQELFLFLA